MKEKYSKIVITIEELAKTDVLTSSIPGGEEKEVVKEDPGKAQNSGKAQLDNFTFSFFDWQ